MTVFDVFPFYNEIDLLKLRMKLLDPVVDYFVISESTTTLSGKPKNMYYEENAELFLQYKRKIIYNPIFENFEGDNFQRDQFQRNQTHSLLKKILSGEDLIIYSDVDEIPNPKKLNEALNICTDEKMVHFAQDVFVYYLNFKEVSGKFTSYTGDYPGIKKPRWLGSRLVSMNYANRFTMTQLRDPVHKATGIRVDNGGWHFTYCGGLPGATIVERVREKMRSSAHQEMMSERVLKKVPNQILKGRDPWGRRGVRIKKVEMNSVIQNSRYYLGCEFDHMILE